MKFFQIILVSVLSVVVLSVIEKLMGRKQIAQLDFFDYISGITIGSIAAELATELEEPWKPLVALAVYGLVSIIMGKIKNRFPKMRKYINGSPTVLMNCGRLYRSNLKKSKLDLSEFLFLCREQGFFDISEIQTVIFEPNGKLSILPISSKRPLTPSDMNIPTEPARAGVEMIMDGRVVDYNLRRVGLDVQWLQRELTLQGYKSIEDIFLGIYYEQTGRLFLYGIE